MLTVTQEQSKSFPDLRGANIGWTVSDPQQTKRLALREKTAGVASPGRWRLQSLSSPGRAQDADYTRTVTSNRAAAAQFGTLRPGEGMTL